MELNCSKCIIAFGTEEQIHFHQLIPGRCYNIKAASAYETSKSRSNACLNARCCFDIDLYPVLLEILPSKTTFFHLIWKNETFPRDIKVYNRLLLTSIHTCSILFLWTVNFITYCIFQKMFGSKFMSLFLIFALMVATINCRRLTTKELIVRIKFCQAKTCNKCAKLIKMSAGDKTTKVRVFALNKN